MRRLAIFVALLAALGGGQTARAGVADEPKGFQPRYSVIHPGDRAGYGPHGWRAYHGYGYGFRGYPHPYRALRFGYPGNVYGRNFVGVGYPYFTYWGFGYPAYGYPPGYGSWQW